MSVKRRFSKVSFVVTCLLVTSIVFPYQFTFTDLGVAHRVSQIQNKMLIINFSSPGCYYCILFDKETISNKEVQEFMRANYIYVKIEPGRQQTTFLGRQYTNDALFGAFGIRGTPTFVFMNGRERVTDVPGYMDASMFLKALRFLVRYVENGLREEFQVYSEKNDVFPGNPKLVTVSKADADYVLKNDKNATQVSRMPASVDIGRVYVTSNQSLANELLKAGVIRVLLIK